jgi:hypothetical protein
MAESVPPEKLMPCSVQWTEEEVAMLHRAVRTFSQVNRQAYSRNNEEI